MLKKGFVVQTGGQCLELIFALSNSCGHFFFIFKKALPCDCTIISYLYTMILYKRFD